MSESRVQFYLDRFGLDILNGEISQLLSKILGTREHQCKKRTFGGKEKIFFYSYMVVKDVQTSDLSRKLKNIYIKYEWREQMNFLDPKKVK